MDRQAERTEQTQHISQVPHVVVIGAGYAGLLFTTRLAGRVSSSDARITLVNDSPTFTERLRMHQFATNHPVRWRSLPAMLANTGVAFVEGQVTAIDTAHRTITVETHEGSNATNAIAYDYLVYALGSLTDRERVPGVADYAYTLAPRGPLSAEAMRERLPDLAQRQGRVIVSGGGPTGVETAAEIASSYPSLSVQLVTAGRLGIVWGAGVSRYIRRSLTRLGVEIRDETTVSTVHADGVITDQGETLPCDLCVWTGGFVAPRLAREAGLVVNERNQAVVDPFMRALSHPEIYAIGDAAYPQEEPGVPVRMAAATATILGAHAADCLSAVLHGEKPQPLSFAYLGQAVALGHDDAIGFNNYPDDKPHRPYFTGQLAYHTRELFVRYLANSARIERHRAGLFYWPGKRRYERTRRQARQQSPTVLEREPTPVSRAS